MTADRTAAAALLLDGYRGTIDDEGEGDADALAAIDHSFSTILWPHSVVAETASRLIGLSFVVVVGGVHYIDPVVTAADHKRRGIGRLVVTSSLRSLRVPEVGAVTTDGNTASEGLFRSLGFVRTGSWG